MAKTMELKLKNGSLIETMSGQSFLTANSPKFRMRSKGQAMVFNGTDQRTYAPNATIGDITTGDFSVEMYVKFNSLSGTEYFISKGGAGAVGYQIRRDGTTLKTEIQDATGASSTISNTVAQGIWYHLVATYDRDGNGIIYLQSIAGTPVSIANKAATLTYATAFSIGSYSGASLFCNCEISLVRQFNTVLTQQEINKLYDEFVHSYPMAKSKTNFVKPVPTDLEKYKGTGAGEGLVAACNMRPTGSTLVDISGNNYNGTISGAISGKDGMSFDGVDDRILIPTISSITLTGTYTILMRYKTGNITVGGLLNYSSSSSDRNAIQLNGGYLNFTTYNGSIYTNKRIASPLNWNSIAMTVSANTVNGYLNGVVLTDTSTATASADGTVKYIGYSSPGYFNGELQDLRIYNRVLSAQEIKDYHNSFITTTLNECFCDAPADGTTTLPREWIAGTGSYKISEITTDDTVLKTIKKGTKYLQNTVAGTIAIPSKTAYGSFKADIYKGGDTNVLDWLFACFTNDNVLGATQNGYFFRFGSDEKMYLYKTTNGTVSAALITSASTYTINTWYNIEVTRTPAGLFTLYVNGTSIGTATDTSFTTALKSTLDFDAGDRIANIIIKDNIKQ